MKQIHLHYYSLLIVISSAILSYGCFGMQVPSIKNIEDTIVLLDKKDTELENAIKIYSKSKNLNDVQQQSPKVISLINDQNAIKYICKKYDTHLVIASPANIALFNDAIDKDIIRHCLSCGTSADSKEIRIFCNNPKQFEIPLLSGALHHGLYNHPFNTLNKGTWIKDDIFSTTRLFLIHGASTLQRITLTPLFSDQGHIYNYSEKPSKWTDKTVFETLVFLKGTTQEKERIVPHITLIHTYEQEILKPASKRDFTKVIDYAFNKEGRGTRRNYGPLRVLFKWIIANNVRKPNVQRTGYWSFWELYKETQKSVETTRKQNFLAPIKIIPDIFGDIHRFIGWCTWWAIQHKYGSEFLFFLNKHADEIPGNWTDLFNHMPPNVLCKITPILVLITLNNTRSCGGFVDCYIACNA